MTVFSRLLISTTYSTPLLRTLIPCLSLVYGLQIAAAVPSIAFQTERFYDLSGSLTYFSATAFSLCLPALRARHAGNVAVRATRASPTLMGLMKGADGVGLNWRQVVVSAAVAIWATRLGSFLFKRVLGDGHDSRFDTVRSHPLKFMGAFMAQATWVSLCLVPVLCLNSVPGSLISKALPGLTIWDTLGLSLFAGGLAFEITADRQKSRWVAEKKAKKHDEDFITSGLWSKSRHPNYFGETTLWTGIAFTCWGVLSSSVGLGTIGLGLGASGQAAAVGLCAVSPAFVTFLLTKVSGIPLSEDKYDARYGETEDYRRWKRETPVFVPKLF